jgi:ferredoxin
VNSSGPLRRAFLKGAGERAAAFVFGAVYLAGTNLKFFTKNLGGGFTQMSETEAKALGITIPIMPPGAGSFEHYLGRCVACQACVTACPVKIVKSKESARPKLDYSGEFCQYSCVECGRVCPTGAIKLLDVEEKRRTRVAVSNLTLDRCVVITKTQACGACAEVCPTRSLRMTPYTETDIQGLTIPAFDEPYCIGCGACLVVCPAVPVAFKVEGVAEQTLTTGIRPTDEDDSELPQLPDTNEFPF